MTYIEKAVRERTALAEPETSTCRNTESKIRDYSAAKKFRMRSSPRSNSVFEVA